MKVAVTGATGNIGSALIKQLADDAGIEEVRAIARRQPEKLPVGTRFVAGDVASDDLTSHLEGADAVVHLAWTFQPTHRPEETWRANVGGAIRLFEAVEKARVPILVYSSSVGAYSPHPGEEPVDESWPTDSLPTAGYGREKAYLERVLDAFEARNNDVRVVRMRPGFVFQRAAASEQRRLFGGPFVPTPLLRLGLPPIFPFPAGMRMQVLHADDAARAFHLALQKEVRGAFNLASEPLVDKALVAEVLGARPIEVPAGIARAGLAAAWAAHLAPAEPALFDLAMKLPIMRTERARSELGWEPSFSSREALLELIGGLAGGAGGDSPPLAGDSASGRAREVATGVGERQGVGGRQKR